MANKTEFSGKVEISEEVNRTASLALALSTAEADLERVEAYDASVVDCYAFRHGTDVVCGQSLALGNMVSGFPLTVNGVRFNNSEAAYIAGMFSDGTERHAAIQQALASNTNGFMAKKTLRRQNQAWAREDFDTFCTEWMLYVVWQKCLTNNDFSRLLRAIPRSVVIIEDSTFQNGAHATLWGTKNREQRRLTAAYKKELTARGLGKGAVKEACNAMRLGVWRHRGVFAGQNAMGKILMICRNALHLDTSPRIDYALLRRAGIHLAGELLTFDEFENSMYRLDMTA